MMFAGCSLARSRERSRPPRQTTATGTTTLRFGLRFGNRDVSNAVLGNQAYGEGYNAAALPFGDEFKGIGIL